MSINCSKGKREIETGFDSSMKPIILTNNKVTTEELTAWKRKIIQEVDNKINSLKHRRKNHNANFVLKHKAVTKYFNDLHEKYVFVEFDKAACNITIIFKKYCKVCHRYFKIYSNFRHWKWNVRKNKYKSGRNSSR